VGLPPDLDIYNPPSLGLQLVNMLTQQLKGVFEFDRRQGTAFKLTLNHEQTSL
jgi:two-component sensor histidine kinase